MNVGNVGMDGMDVRVFGCLGVRPRVLYIEVCCSTLHTRQGCSTRMHSTGQGRDSGMQHVDRDTDQDRVPIRASLSSVSGTSG